MPMLELSILLALLALLWFWMDSLKAREIGVGAGRHACETENLQLLDDTVSLESLRVVRNDARQLALRRTYGFEYSDTGNNRRKGHVTLVGRHVIMVYTGPRAVPGSNALLH